MMQITGYLPLKAANKKRSASLEKLASGVKLNRASDGAAELGISWSMRAQIRATNMQNRNAQDGISLIQTAEGALEEINSMLRRMSELCIQSANGIYTDTERLSCQQEVENLKNEIDRIATSTTYNGIPLLNGQLGSGIKGEVFEIQSNITGNSAKPEVNEIATWEGEIDFSNLHDGATLKINNVVFEFDTDGVINTPGGVSISLTGNISADVSSLETAITTNSALSTRLDNAAFVNNGGNNYTLTLTTKSTNVIDGEGFEVISSPVTPVRYGSSKVIDGIDFGGGIGIGKTFEISGIDMTTMVEGTTFSINGIVYEIDKDGVLNNPTAKKIDFTTATDSVKKAKILRDTIKSDFPGVTINFLKEDGDIYKFSMAYNDYAPPSSQPTNIVFNPTSPNAPTLNVSKNEKAVHIPAQPNRAASRVDEIDFSKISDGSIIEIGGVKFEFDNNGIASEKSSVLVDFKQAKKPSDIAILLEAAFQNSEAAVSFSMLASVVNEQHARLEITSKSYIDDESIEVQYNVGKKEEDTGLVLQIGDNESGRMRFNIEGATATLLNITNVDASSAEKAMSSLQDIKKAINAVSLNRGGLGAAQNRLECTRNSLGVYAENLTASEDRISSTDMAKEMMNFTKEDILSQSSQAMIAQAFNLNKNEVQQILQQG